MARLILPMAAMEKICKKAGAERVSDKAKMTFSEILEEVGVNMAEKALRFAKHSGRKTIKSEDIKLAYKS